MGWLDLGTGIGPRNTKELNEMLFGKGPSIQTQTLKDPMKESVASPLSRFLSEQTGQGVPRFGKQILTDLPEGGGGSVSDFLKMDEESFFNQYVKDPAISTFEEELLPLIHEDFAGSLSGSGRLRAEGDAARGLARDLAVSRGQFAMDLPAKQLELSTKMKEQNDKEAQAQYTDWLKSLPIYNPALQQSLQFLSEGTNTGTTVLSYLDQGQKGIFGDLLAALITGGASIYGANIIAKGD
jgi:hypothetical protein